MRKPELGEQEKKELSLEELLSLFELHRSGEIRVKAAKKLVDIAGYDILPRLLHDPQLPDEVKDRSYMRIADLKAQEKDYDALISMALDPSLRHSVKDYAGIKLVDAVIEGNDPNYALLMCKNHSYSRRIREYAGLKYLYSIGNKDIVGISDVFLGIARDVSIPMPVREKAGMEYPELFKLEIERGYRCLYRLPMLRELALDRKIPQKSRDYFVRIIIEEGQGEEWYHDELFAFTKRDDLSDDVRIAAGLKFIQMSHNQAGYNGLITLISEERFLDQVRAAAAAKLIEMAEQSRCYTGILDVCTSPALPEKLKERAGLMLVDRYCKAGDYIALIKLAKQGPGKSAPLLIHTLAGSLVDDTAVRRAYSFVEQGDYKAVIGIGQDKRLSEDAREEAFRLAEYAAAVKIDSLAQSGDYAALAVMHTDLMLPESMRSLASALIEIATAKKIGEAYQNGDCKSLAQIASDSGEVSDLTRMIADVKLSDRLDSLAQRL